MTPEFLEKARKDYEQLTSDIDWQSFLKGYIAAVKRFGGR